MYMTVLGVFETVVMVHQATVRCSRITLTYYVLVFYLLHLNILLPAEDNYFSSSTKITKLSTKITPHALTPLGTNSPAALNAS